MNRLSSNVASSVLAGIIGVLFVLVGIDSISALFNEAEDLGADYGFLNALAYIGMTLPARIYEFIPFAALIGCLIGLGVLAGNSELVVMRAAGVSLLRIVWFVMRPVLTVVVISVVIAEFLVPVTDQYAETYRALRLSGKQVQASSTDLWNKEGNEFMHFNIVAPGGVLYGVTRYRFDDQRKVREASFARRATFYGNYWQEEEVAVTHFLEDRTEVSEQLFRRWETTLSPELLNLISIREDSLSIRGLYAYARYLQEQRQNAQRYWLAFWNKTLQPFSVLSLVLVAISFIFGPLRQATMGFRIFAGAVFGLTFWISQQMLGPSSLVFGFSPAIAVLAPVLACMLIGLVLLRRAA